MLQIQRKYMYCYVQICFCIIAMHVGYPLPVRLPFRAWSRTSQGTSQTGAHIRGEGGDTPMFCEMYLKSRSRNLNGAKKSVRLKAEIHYHFVSKKRNRWTFWKWNCLKITKKHIQTKISIILYQQQIINFRVATGQPT